MPAIQSGPCFLLGSWPNEDAQLRTRCSNKGKCSRFLPKRDEEQRKRFVDAFSWNRPQSKRLYFQKVTYRSLVN